MIQIIIILILVIIGLLTTAYFWIKSLRKKLASSEKKVDMFNERINFYQKNRQAYDSVIEKLIEGKNNADKLREKVNNSDGSDLSDILNEL